MSNLDGFDKWFGTNKWREGSGRFITKIEYESAPGVWVDMSEWITSLTVNYHDVDCDCKFCTGYKPSGDE